MFNALTVVPAYGNDYGSIAAVEQAWENHKDFRAYNGYVNNMDIPHLLRVGFTHIAIRYCNKEKKHIIRLSLQGFQQNQLQQNL